MCAYHSRHPITRTAEEIRRLIDFNENETKINNEEIARAHRSIASKVQWGNQLYVILDGLYSDLSVLERMADKE